MNCSAANALEKTSDPKTIEMRGFNIVSSNKLLGVMFEFTECYGLLSGLGEISFSF